MFPNRIFPSLSVCLSACTCVFPMAKEWILIFIHYPSVIIDPQVGLASRRKKGSRPNLFATFEPQKPQIWFPNCVQFADRAGLEALTLDNVWSGGGYSFRKIDISHAEEEEEGDEERKKVVLVSPEFACWMDRPNSHGATYALMLLRPSLTYFIIARRWLASPIDIRNAIMECWFKSSQFCFLFFPGLLYSVRSLQSTCMKAFIRVRPGQIDIKHSVVWTASIPQ